MRRPRLSGPAAKPLAVPVAAVLAIAGCAGGDDTPAAAPSSPASAAGSAATTTPAPPAAPTAAASPAPDATATPATPASTSTTPGSGGSGGSGGVAGLPAADIVTRARQAATAASSVRLRGQVADDRRTAQLDLRLAAGGCSGTIGNGALKVSLVLTGTDLYLQGDEAFWRQTSPQVAQLVGDKWVKTPSSSAQFAPLVAFCDKGKLFERLLDDRLTVRKGEQRTLEGQRTVALTGREGGTLYIATEGEPYPVRIQPGKDQRGAGRVDFSEWNDPQVVAAPPAGQVIDVGALRPSGPPAPAATPS